MRSTPVFVSLLALLFVRGAHSVNLFGQSFRGKATYYGNNGGSGHCSFSFSNSQVLSWASGITNRVAINSNLYLGSGTCGLCVAYRGLGTGVGNTPVPSQWQYALVSNACPSCPGVGDLDIEANGDGIWDIEWYPVACNVGGGKFRYSFQGSNNYYIKMAVTNTRVPVESIQLQVQGVWRDMQRSVDNYWIIQSLDGQCCLFPAQVRVTSVFGDSVIDTIALSSPTGQVDGNQQFPLPAGVPVVGSTGNTTPNLTAVQPPPPPAPPAPTSTPTPAPPPPATTTPAAASDTPAQAGDYEQCGGRGASCTGDFCQDVKYSDNPCSNINFGCLRINEWYWQCVPAAFVKSVVPASPTPPPIPQTANCGALPVGAYTQCGGLGGYCAGSQCVDGTWAGACCEDAGYTCVKYDKWYRQCRPDAFEV
ncbi:hypothetical protein WJX72_000218 [[Myrmecia] bisecta]|uniref:CBM1 domain-containing protein n=1 Tax=[Myrmecia] bisecta TaxID=41462 RepID=A0AAW1QNL1_9CHLO